MHEKYLLLLLLVVISYISVVFRTMKIMEKRKLMLKDMKNTADQNPNSNLKLAFEMIDSEVYFKR